MKLLIIGVLFWHGVQTTSITVIGEADMQTCKLHILPENNKPDYTTPQGKTVWTCVDQQTYRALANGLLSIDTNGQVQRNDEL